MKQLLHFLIILIIASCTPAAEMPVSTDTASPDTAVTSPPGGSEPVNPPVDPLAPKPSDANFTRGNIFIQESDLLIRESFPPQISLNFSGDLPTPCHELRAVVNPPNEENKIIVDVYSVVDPNIACTQVLKPFEESIDLGIYPNGHYTLWLNSEMVGEFDT
jgi:hypothetical protein